MGENFYSCILGMGRVQIQPDGSVLANPIDKSISVFNGTKFPQEPYSPTQIIIF